MIGKLVAVCELGGVGGCKMVVQKFGDDGLCGGGDVVKMMVGEGDERRRW